MLRKIRLTLAILFWVLITWLLVDFTGTAHAYLGWMAKIQFLPALLASNLVIVAVLLVLSLFLGRIYCSVICPLGVMQDAIAWFRKKKHKYSYSPAKNWLRYTVLVLFVVLLAIPVTHFVATLLAPYSTYGRIVASVLAPLYKLGNNALAQLAERQGSYAMYGVDVWLKSGLTLVLSLVVWAIIAILAWRGGRTWCNTLCPVGSLLSLVSRFSVFGPVVDEEKCNKCGLCARNCKASCIDSKNGKVDMSRCVMCGNCMETCTKNAMHLAPRPLKAICGKSTKAHTQDEGRRAMLTGTALLAGTALLRAQEKTTDGGYAVIEKKQIPQRQHKIVPPGSVSVANMHVNCTTCQLCVSACPNDVLRPSSDLSRLMQPEVSYERGYCRPECNRCSQVCPTGAIKPIKVEDRTAIQVGHAVWIKDNCVVLRDGVSCGLCARKCPAEAIQMVPLDESNPKGPQIPVVNDEKCIGCGACENLCPSRPLSAIYVEGHEVHKEI